MGDDLTHIETRADLRIQKRGPEPAFLTGRIDTLRGQYDAYGRDFSVEEGAITFIGRPDNNPLLNLHALHRRGLTTIFLDLLGTAKKPELHLRSNPPMPKPDIVSVLVTGKPLREWSGSEIAANDAQRRTQALSVIGQALAHTASRQLRRKGMDVFALDLVQVEPFTQGGSQLSLGRYIGDKLFVTL